MQEDTARDRFRAHWVRGFVVCVMAVVLGTSACTARTVTSSSLAATTSTIADPPTLPGATEAFQPASCDAILDPLAPPVANGVCGYVSRP